jgi:hypothetical protein
MYILYFGSNKDFEENKSRIEILTKVVLRVFLKKQTYGFRMAQGVKGFRKDFMGSVVKVFS